MYQYLHYTSIHAPDILHVSLSGPGLGINIANKLSATRSEQ